jgi:osmotically-inducible protein OsmY
MKENRNNYKGKGPKGFKRSDARIKELVCERLTFSKDVDASGFEVAVSEGLVTLEGVVNNKKEKWIAEDLIDDISGVRDVHNHLTVDKKVDGWIPREINEIRDLNKPI